MPNANNINSSACSVPLADLELSLTELNEDLSDAATLCAVGDERIKYIQDFFLPYIALTNSQQTTLIDDYNAQVSASGGSLGRVRQVV